MPKNLDSSTKLNTNARAVPGEALRLLSRSPHPYHRESLQLPDGPISTTSPAAPSPLRSRQNTDDEDSFGGQSSYSKDSDSGTEADDEHFLKGLPAPRARPHKGLRGAPDGSYSSTPSPLLSPSILNDGVRTIAWQRKREIDAIQAENGRELQDAAEKFGRKRRAELARRAIEVLLLAIVGVIIFSNNDVRLAVGLSRYEISCHIVVAGSLVALYPLRLAYYHMREKPSRDPSKRDSYISIPAYFEPAPLLYPPALTVFVASLLSVSNSGVVLPNIILSLASLPPSLIPTLDGDQGIPVAHWFLSCLPLFTSELGKPFSNTAIEQQGLNPSAAQHLNRELLVLLCPLHQTLCVTLHSLTKTSLLTAELQLLSITLINILLLSVSPQAIILKALLWGGGVATFVTCGKVLSWNVSLARVPKWRFRSAANRSKRLEQASGRSSTGLLAYSWLKRVFPIIDKIRADESDDDDRTLKSVTAKPSGSTFEVSSISRDAMKSKWDPPLSLMEQRPEGDLFGNGTALRDFGDIPTVQRRYTLPSLGHQLNRFGKKTPSGRRKRSASSGMQSFFSLTEKQATLRKWLYAIYVYFCIILIILIGIRGYVGQYALGGKEPVGWALGYLFGGLPRFRLEVVTANLERWICLPEWSTMRDSESCHRGWVEHLRYTTFTPANTRLILGTYWLTIIIVGLAVVFQLSAVYEVDTRRKVFHFMMVAMLLPATYVDPTFAALALMLVLTVFLLLDLFRATQLPPLSKPLASFLTPYVDGRDLRGPVVISHIFLLVGCATPLWLSLGALPRAGRGCAAGWELPTRELGMVSGVICVGLGDAAASLIGRRYGCHKWFWSGGKSVEGSLAFATVVALALLLARAWLLLGGWPVTPTPHAAGWTLSLAKAVIAAVVASLTEAVLTGGNDNVVVPVVLWLCVKGLRV